VVLLVVTVQQPGHSFHCNALHNELMRHTFRMTV
jgi:hypothetical protein